MSTPVTRGVDRALHLILKFAAYPSQLETTARTRGAAFAEGLRGFFENNAGVITSSYSGPNPVLRAILDDELGTATRLIDENEKDLERPNWHGQRPLHFALAVGRRTFVPVLLERGADPNAGDGWNNTPMHWAVFTGDDVSAQALAVAGADDWRRNDLDGSADDYRRILGDVPSEAVATAVRDPASGELESWEPRRVIDEIGFRPQTESVAGNDFLFEMFIRNRTSSTKPIHRFVEPERVVHTHLQRYPEPFNWGLALSEAAAEGAYVGSYCGRIEPFSISAASHEYACSIGPQRRDFRLQIVGRQVGTKMTRANSSHASHADNVKARFGWRRGLPVIDFYARRELPAGTQLVWYYGDEFWEGATPLPVESG